MRRICILGLMMFNVVLGDEQHKEEKSTVSVVYDSNTNADSVDSGLANTDIVISFVVFRHGDRTPDLDELEKVPAENDNYKNVFFPYGVKALTNVGKQRGYRVGEYLRKRYNGLISTMYLPDEISARTTDFARTKMSVLTALAAMYPPTAAQRWNPFLNWQPIPYDTIAFADDDLMYYYNCPRYLDLRIVTYNVPEVQKMIKPYEGLFKYLMEKTGGNITTPEDVFYLDNLFQALENVGIKTPKWAQDVMPQIKEMTLIDYICQFYNEEMIRLSSGVLLNDFMKIASDAIEGNKEVAKLHLVSAHENTVAAFMSAMKVFKPHQPNYSSIISLELRRRKLTGKYGFTAVYATDPQEQGVIIPIEGCGGQDVCDYDTFRTLTKDYLLPRSEYKKSCSV